MVPEASQGGPLAKIQTGDVIRLDATTGELLAQIDETELKSRTEAQAPNVPRTVSRGLFSNNRLAVSSAEEGASSLFIEEGMSDASIGAKPHYLVGDIGGTNALCLCNARTAQPQSLAKYRVADFQNFDEVMARLITDWRALGLPEEGPTATCGSRCATARGNYQFYQQPMAVRSSLLGRYLSNSSIEIINDLRLSHALCQRFRLPM